MKPILRSHWAGPALCATVTLVLFAIGYAAGGTTFPTDDAFINLHNARVLRLGHDDTYAGVPALVGATSGVHLALLAGIERIIQPDAAALFVLGALTGVLYVLGVFGIAINAGCSRPEATLIALSGLVIAGVIFQLMNGMDTGLAMTAVAWNIKLITDKRRSYWLPILCGLMPFIRPELSFLSAGSMLILFRESGRSPRFKTAAAGLGILAAAPFLVWYWIDTGSLIPNTVGAKTYFFAERYADWTDKARFILTALAYAVVASFPLVLCFRAMRPRAVALLLTLFAAVFLASFFWRFPGGLVHNGGRYLYVFLPILLFAIACGLTSSFRRQTLRLAAIAILFLPLGFLAQWSDYRTHLRGDRQSLIDLVSWMDANLTERPTVMVHDAGYAAYAGHVPLVDLVGLKTPAASAIHKALTYPSVGRLRSDAVAQIAADFQPRYLVVLQDWDDKFRLVDGLRDKGWTVSEVHEGRAAPETPKADIYRLYRLASPHPG